LRKLLTTNDLGRAGGGQGVSRWRLVGKWDGGKVGRTYKDNGW